MQNLIDIACRHCEIADQMFDRWSISGRYLVFGDKADLSQLKALELYELASSMWTVRMTRTSPMPDRFTRASFFSGIGGLELAAGFEIVRLYE